MTVPLNTPLGALIKRADHQPSGSQKYTHKTKESPSTAGTQGASSKLGKSNRHHGHKLHEREQFQAVIRGALRQAREKQPNDCTCSQDEPTLSKQDLVDTLSELGLDAQALNKALSELDFGALQEQLATLNLEGLQDQLQPLDLNGQIEALQEALVALTAQLPSDQQAVVKEVADGLLKLQALLTNSESNSLQDHFNNALQQPIQNLTQQLNQEHLPPEAKEALEQVLAKLETLNQIKDEHQLLQHPPSLQKAMRSLSQLALQAQLIQPEQTANEASDTLDPFNLQLKQQITGTDQSAIAVTEIQPVLDTTVNADTTQTTTPTLEVSSLGETTITDTPSLKGAVSTSATGLSSSSAPKPVQTQVVEVAQMALEKGESKFTVQLNPESLGRVRFTLTSDLNNHITARLVAEHAETKQVLETHVKELHHALERQGLQVARVTVVLASSDSNPTQSDHSHQGSSSQPNPEERSFGDSGSSNSSGRQHPNQSQSQSTVAYETTSDSGLWETNPTATDLWEEPSDQPLTGPESPTYTLTPDGQISLLH